LFFFGSGYWSQPGETDHVTDLISGSKLKTK